MAVVSSVVLPLAAGLVLAAVAGLRAFLPLAVLGLAGRMGWVELGSGFTWLSSTPALITFWSACVAELLGDKIPAVDHALDAVGTVLRPLSGAVAVAAMAAHLGPPWATILAIVVGGGAAGVVHLGKVSTRLASSTLSFGLANALLSVVEDLASASLAILAVALPLVALALLAVMALVAWRTIRWLAGASAGANPAAAPPAGP